MSEPAINETKAAEIFNDGYKVCSHCGIVKPVATGFYKSANTVDGYEGKCRKCRAQKAREIHKSKRLGLVDLEAPQAVSPAAPVEKKARLKQAETPLPPAIPDPDLPKPKVPALADQIGGDHYKNFAIQPIEFSTRNNLGFIQGCVVKRICRYNQPGGKGIQDLEKIIHEIKCLIDISGLGTAGEHAI